MYGDSMLGFSPEEKAQYKLLQFEDYVYLKGGNGQLRNEYNRIYTDIGVDKPWSPREDLKPEAEPRIFNDATKMAETKKALSNFFTPAQIDVIWRVTHICCDGCGALTRWCRSLLGV